VIFWAPNFAVIKPKASQLPPPYSVHQAAETVGEADQMHGFHAARRVSALASVFATLSLAIALIACFAVVMFSWPNPDDRAQVARRTVIDCCDVVVTGSVGRAPGEEIDVPVVRTKLLPRRRD
jgi:hypothetical protein